MKGDPGHDWSHADRVRKIALYIGKKERADLFIVELAALLHDIADYKFHNGDESLGSRIATKWLKRFDIHLSTIKEISYIVREVSFKGAKVKSKMKTIEGMVVRDADKLDALGAIGVARTFSYAGYFGIPMHVPGIKPTLHRTFAEYKKNSRSTINHFYEKLLLLKDKMHTKTGKRLAEERHRFIEAYLKQFLREWKVI